MAWFKAGLLGAVVLAIGMGYFLWLRPLERKAQERDILIRRVEDYRAVIKTAQDAHSAQVAALEKERKAAVARSQALGKQLERIEYYNEQIPCPVPAVLRDSIESLPNGL